MANYQGEDIYCDVIIPRKAEIEVVKETDKILAYRHIKPFWPVHVVVTPKQHILSLLELDNELALELLSVVKEVAKTVKEENGAARVLTNLGEYQDSKHLHIHVSSGDPLR